MNKKLVSGVISASVLAVPTLASAEGTATPTTLIQNFGNEITTMIMVSTPILGGVTFGVLGLLYNFSFDAGKKSQYRSWMIKTLITTAITMCSSMIINWVIGIATKAQ